MISILSRIWKVCIYEINREKRVLSDSLGSVITREWEKSPSQNIFTVDPSTYSEVIRIYQKVFNATSEANFFRYSKIFNPIFYIAEKGSKVVGYCVYYIKPSLTLSGIRKIAVVYSIAVDEEYQGQGIGKQLLAVSIQEMKFNGIDEILLYVSITNSPAILLYKKFGFVMVGEISNLWGDGEDYYEMRLVL